MTVIIMRCLFSLTKFSILAGLILGVSISNKYVFAQPAGSENGQVEQSTAVKTKQRIHRIGTTFSSGYKKSISIKSTDADINSRYPQPLECWNCDFENYINNTTGILSDGIIEGVIRSEVFRRRAHQHHIDNFNNKNDQNRHFDNQLFHHGSQYDADTTFDIDQYPEGK